MKIKTHLHVHEANRLQIWYWRKIRGCSLRKIAMNSSSDTCDDQNCGTTICRKVMGKWYN